MLDLSHTIRCFNRFELKYLIPLKDAERFKAALRAYLIPDTHGNAQGRYVISSLYYDSPDLRCYWEKIDGVKYRRKLRIRYYEHLQDLQKDTPVFVEIKQRLDRVTQKRRVILPYEQALRLCNEREIPEHAVQEKTMVDEVYTFLWQDNLRPTSIVRYERQAFIGSDYDIGLRVTFDTKLGFQCQHLRLHEHFSGLALFPTDQVVMEIKVNERIPYWLTELVAKHNFTLMRISKYCRSIELSLQVPSTNGNTPVI